MSDDELQTFTPYQTPQVQPEPPLEEEVRPWGPGWALLWSFVVMCVWALAQTVIMVALAFRELGREGLTQEGLAKFGEKVTQDGDLMGLIGFGSAIVGCVMILLIVRTKGVSLSKGLALRKARKWWMWLLIIPGYLLGGVLIALVTGLIQTDKAIEDQANIATMVGNTDSFFLLFLGVSVGAPLFEEFLFRGLLHEGLRQSFLGRIGSGLLTALVFSLIHMQYKDPSAFVALFMLGCYFTLARELTGSLWASVSMHCLQNTIVTATMFMAFHGMIPEDQMPEELREIFNSKDSVEEVIEESAPLTPAEG